MTDRFQGDMKIILSEDGADLDIRGGQPLMDGGLANAVILSLLTEAGWSPEVLLPSAQHFGGKFMAESKKPITVSSLSALQNAAQSDLQWMLTEGLANNVKVVVRNPESRRLEVVVMIWPPGKEAITVFLSKYGPNWVSQETNPNSLR